MNFKWENFLNLHRSEIILEWIKKLKTDVSVHYAKRSPKELRMTTAKAYDSFYQVLVHNNYEPINDFINEITKIRLEAGFALDDVQKAFEIYRQLILPILVKESEGANLYEKIEAVNNILAYTIHRFSNHFQKMHQKYRGQLTASLSHEIRNPLSSVKMNLQILSKNIILSSNDRKRIEISKNEIDRLEGILQGLLNYSNPLLLKCALININQIVVSCVELLEIKFHRKSIDYKVEVDTKLKIVFADEGKLEQIIINLLLNALDSVNDFGSIKIFTAQKKYNKKDYAMIRVEDDGKGIPKELLPHIFKPFYTTKTRGNGIGLANVKHIADAHHGEVTVINLEKRGTAFEVLLPMGKNQ